MFNFKKLYVRMIMTFIVIAVAVFSSALSVQAESTKFKDVNSKTYHYEAIIELAERGVVQGYLDGTFKPNRSITRGQAAKMIASLIEIDDWSKGQMAFKDVPATHEFSDPILALAASGVISGFADGTFRPNESITRAQMAKMLHIAFQLKDVESGEIPFTDVQAGDWFAGYVESLRRTNVTTGTTATTFSPHEFVTRGQLASFVVRGEKIVYKAGLALSTFAGSGAFGQVDGQVGRASFRSPAGIISLQDGTLLVADQENHLIRKIADKKVTTFAGMTFSQNEQRMPEGGFHNDRKELAMFNEPSALAADQMGNVFIADSANHAIRKISADGQVTTVAGDGFIGTQDGEGIQARFYHPSALAIAKDGTLYVADTLNHTIRKITPAGKVSTLNTPSLRPVEVAQGVVQLAGDFKDGALTEAKFNEPSGLVLDDSGNLYVSDSGNQLIRYIDFATNQVTTVAGKLPNLQSSALYAKGNLTDGAALSAEFHFPKGLALTEDGGIVIADSMNRAIRYLKNGQVVTIASELNKPTDVTVDQNGVIYLADPHQQLIHQLK